MAISFKTFSATYLSSGHLQHSAVSAFSLHLIIWVLLCSTIKSHWLLLQSANKEARMWRPLWQKRDIFGANPTFHNTLLTKLESESVFPTCGTTLLLTRVFRGRSGADQDLGIIPLTPKRRSFPNSHALTDWVPNSCRSGPGADNLLPAQKGKIRNITSHTGHCTQNFISS